MAENEVTVTIRGNDKVSALLRQTAKNFDDIAKKAKEVPLEKKVKIDVNTVDAKKRIDELNKAIAGFQAKASSGKITVGDVSGFKQATSELKQLEAGLASMRGEAAQGTSVIEQLAGGIGGKLVGALSLAAVGKAALEIGQMAVELGNLGQQVQQQRAYFEVWSGGVANATDNLNAMRAAIGNVMTDSEAMASANKLLSMGLARNSSELANLSRMAVMLGGSTRTASESIEEFSLLLANQSILRLDTFGISGARVRERIEELMSANKDLTREQAFLNAVMEEGSAKVDALAAAGVKATTSAQDLDTAFRGLKEAVGVGLAGPIAEAQSNLAETLNQLASLVRGTSILNDVLTLDPGSEAQLVAITQRLEYLRDLVERSANGENIYRFNAENALKEIAELEAQTYSAGGAELDMAEKLRMSRDAALEAASAQRELNTARAVSDPYGPAATRSRALVARYEGITGAQSAEQEEYGRAMALLRGRETRINEENAANAKIAEDAAQKYTSAMSDATDTIASDIQSKFSQAMSNAKGLLDLTGGAGGDLFAPGANGPFENIYRALDVAKLGAASPWAQALGLTQEDAKRISTDFQRGLFTEEVQGLINVDQLLGQIQGEQDAAASGAKFAQMLAGRLGVKDAGALVASQTFQAIAGGIEADPTQQQDAAQRVLDAYLNNVEGVVNGKAYAERMVAYGGVSWQYYETGLLEGAKSSTVFASAVDAAIGAWMARQAAPKQPTGVVGAAAAMGVTP